MEPKPRIKSCKIQKKITKVNSIEHKDKLIKHSKEETIKMENLNNRKKNCGLINTRYQNTSIS